MEKFIKGDIVVIPFRSNRLFTADSRIVLYKAGNLKAKKVRIVIDKIVRILYGE